MADIAAECGAFGEAIVFLEYFRDLPDPRQRGKVTYPLEEVLLLSLLAVLAGAESFVDIARFGDKKLELLRRFRPFRDGTPSHDHLGDIFATLDAEAFQRCFVAWVTSLTGAPAEVIAIDRFIAADLGVLEARGPLLGDEQLDILAQRSLIALQREHVISLLVDNLAGNLALAAHGIDGDDGTLDRHHVEELGDGEDLVGFVGHLDLTHDETLAGGEG